MIAVGLNPEEVGGGHALMLVAPAGMEESCDPLAVVSQTYQDGSTCLLSRWTPSPEERAALASGADVLLYVWGVTQPPVAIGVVSAEEG